MTALALPILLGLIVSAVGAFDEPREAIRHLNRYALVVAFPALILRGLLDPGFSWPTSPGPYLIAPLALVMVLLLVGPWLRAQDRGVLALTTGLGNVAYLGLPLVVEVLGDGALGIAALLATEHVVLGLVVGPTLLLRGRGDPPSAALAQLVRQPLLWAPVVAVPLRWLPWAGEVRTVTAPVAASAAPIALFVLGVYLHQERATIRRFSGALALQVASKLLLLPAATGLTLGALGLVGQPIAPETAAVAMLLSGMPSAITTFTLAASFDVAPAAVARIVVASTLLCPATLWLLHRLA